MVRGVNASPLEKMAHIRMEFLVFTYTVSRNDAPRRIDRAIAKVDSGKFVIELSGEERERGRARGRFGFII